MTALRVRWKMVLGQLHRKGRGLGCHVLRGRQSWGATGDLSASAGIHTGWNTGGQAASGTRHGLLGLALVGIALAGGGCLDRSITITSQPPGARVWLNEVEVGRTPVTTRFKFHGDYDIRLSLPGHEPIHAMRTAHAPLHEQPGIDLVAMALPWRFTNDFTWHFELSPALEIEQSTAELERGLLERAHDLQGQLDPES